MEEKKCKYCAMMIPKEAKICPHCRKKQGMSLLVKFALGFIGFILLVGNFPSFIGDKNKGGLASGIPSLDDYKESAKKAAAEVDSRIQLNEKGKKLKAKHSDWSNDVCNTIAEKNIRIGMTREQVTVAWEKPYKVNTTTGAYGEHEQWVMRESSNSDYLYFDNGVLSSIQQSR